MHISENLMMPIAELTAAVRLQMIKLRYSPPTMCIYDCIWKDLIAYCDEHRILRFNLDTGNQFALDCYGHSIGTSCSKNDDFRKKTVGRAMQYLLDYQHYGVIFECSSRGKYRWHPRFKELFDSYIADMIKTGYAESTLITIKSCLQGFETFLLQKNIISFADLTRADIEAFILTFAKYARSTLPNRLYYLRVLLNFAFQNGYHQEELASVCPNVRHISTRNAIPATFSSDEVERILASVDRANPKGKRDYAILLLVTRLGLRSVDVRNLKFSDIDWHKKQLHIFQSKTQESVLLPLLDDIGWAIIDYLKNGRPQTTCEYVFVKHIQYNGYYGELETNPYSVLQKYLSRANIAAEYERKQGLHALRHSLASELLLNEIPLPVISGILGHVNSNSTSVYLKVDIPQLRRCALEVPL